MIGKPSMMTHYLKGEIQRLEGEWPLLLRTAAPFPAFSWDDLLEALLEETASPVEEMVIRGALAALLKTAPFKPPELILREVLVLASSAFDLAMRPASGSTSSGQMSPDHTSEVDMI